MLRYFEMSEQITRSAESYPRRTEPLVFYFSVKTERNLTFLTECRRRGNRRQSPHWNDIGIAKKLVVLTVLLLAKEKSFTQL